MKSAPASVSPGPGYARLTPVQSHAEHAQRGSVVLRAKTWKPGRIKGAFLQREVLPELENINFWD